MRAQDGLVVAVSCGGDPAHAVARMDPTTAAPLRKTTAARGERERPDRALDGPKRAQQEVEGSLDVEEGQSTDFEATGEAGAELIGDIEFDARNVQVRSDDKGAGGTTEDEAELYVHKLMEREYEFKMITVTA